MISFDISRYSESGRVLFLKCVSVDYTGSLSSSSRRPVFSQCTLDSLIFAASVYTGRTKIHSLTHSQGLDLSLSEVSQLANKIPYVALSMK